MLESKELMNSERFVTIFIPVCSCYQFILTVLSNQKSEHNNLTSLGVLMESIGQNISNQN